jgi:hypothetical protein
MNPFMYVYPLNGELRIWIDTAGALAPNANLRVHKTGTQHKITKQKPNFEIELETEGSNRSQRRRS